MTPLQKRGLKELQGRIATCHRKVSEARQTVKSHPDAAESHCHAAALEIDGAAELLADILAS